jgi:hypothetical protein
MNEVASEAKHAHPKYCFKMATGTGKTWVMQALMIWQLLNKTATLARGYRRCALYPQFMVVAPGLIVYERLLDAFCGKLMAGSEFAGLQRCRTYSSLPTCSCPRRTARRCLPLCAAMSAASPRSA